jgi:23S rRNA-/tRNA-specific pseudouridylate synthase
VKRQPVLVVCKQATTVSAVLPRLGEGAAQALEDGRIFVGKRRASATDPVRAGDEVWMYPARLPPPERARILLEREGVVAVYKPAQMATVADHRGSRGSLEAVVAEMLGGKGEIVATSRLDVGVSGVVLFAADEAARQRLARAREQGRYLRHYVAVAARAPDPERGVWSGPIGRASDPRRRQVGGQSATLAETAYAVTALADKGALLSIEPQTGRTHQIRVHAAHAGAPLWGDTAYGGPTRLVAPGGAITVVERIALHAAWVEVPLAGNGNLHAEAPLSSDFETIWIGCGGDTSAFAGALRPIYSRGR